MTPTEVGSKVILGSFGVIDLLVTIYEKWSLYPHTLMYLHGTWTQLYLGRVGDRESRRDSWFENRLFNSKPFRMNE